MNLAYRNCMFTHNIIIALKFLVLNDSKSGQTHSQKRENKQKTRVVCSNDLLLKFAHAEKLRF